MWWLMVGTLAGCPAAPVPAVAVPRLVVPAEVSRGDLPVGSTAIVALRIENAGLADAQVRLLADAPLGAPTGSFEILAGRALSMPIAVHLGAYEEQTTTLTILADDGRHDVAFRLRGDPDRDQDGALAIGAGGDDCDDARRDIGPGAPESCDGVDEDCDGDIDEDPVDPPTWWSDADGDGYGAAIDAWAGCEAAPGVAGQAGDCDDAEAARAPGAPERDNAVDDDCDSRVDEHLVASGDLRVVELHPRPDVVPAARGSFVELWNGSDREIRLDGYALWTDVGVVSLVGILPPGEVNVYCADVDPLWNGGIEGCAGQAPLLSVAGRVRLVGDTVLDAVDYRGWSVPAGQSVILGAPGREGPVPADAADWCFGDSTYGFGDRGTPGDLSGCD